MKIWSTAFAAFLLICSPMIVQGAPLDTAIRPFITTNPTLTLRPDPIKEKGDQLDNLSQKFFQQKQAQKAVQIQQEEAMIDELARSLATRSSGGKKPSFFFTFSKTFKTNLHTAVRQPSLPNIGTVNINLGSTSAPVTADQISQAVTEAFALLLTDAQIQSGTQLLPEHVALAGKIVNALTILSVAPLGFRPHQPSCGYLIVGTNLLDGPQGSALSAYFQSIPYKDDSPASQANRLQALAALKRVHQGIRCLPNRDFSSVDSSFAAALIETYLRAHREGKVQVAYGLIDASLNLALLMFDGIKYFHIPQTSRIFCLAKNPSETLVGRVGAVPEFQLREPYGPLQIDGAVLSPALGRDYGGQCDLSLMRLLLEDPQNADKAILKIVGVWLENPHELGSPLTKVVFRSLMRPPLTLIEFIQRLVEFRNWGEGDCTMQEFVTNGGLCQSMATCEMMEDLSAVTGSLPGLLRGASGLQMGSSQVGRYAGTPGGFIGGTSTSTRSSAPATVPNGAEGSPNTLFGVPRADVSSHCGSRGGGGGGGGGGQNACSMPTGSQRLFSVDPEMNQLMQCAVVAVSGNINVQTDFSRSPACKIAVNLTGTETEAERATREAAERHRAEAAERLQREIDDESNDGLVHRLGEELRSRGHDVLDVEVRNALQRMVEEVRTAGLDSSLDRPGTRSSDAYGEWDGRDITFDTEHAAEGGENFETTAIHEAIHGAIDFLGAPGSNFWGGATFYGGPALDRPVTSTREQHRIIEALGYRQCDPSSMEACNSSCGYADERLARFKDCVSPDARSSGRTIWDGWCNINPDACDDRRGDDGSAPGGLGEQCIGSVVLDPRCLLLTCGEEGHCPAYCMPGGGGIGTAGGTGGSGPGGTSILSGICAHTPDGCGTDGRGGFDGAAGGGGIPGTDIGGPQPPPEAAPQ